MSHLKAKIYLGYLSLLIIAVLAGYIIHKDFFAYQQQELLQQPKASEISYVNSILSKLYKAEGMINNHSSSQNIKKYTKLMDSISSQIDSLSLIVLHPSIAQNLDSIKQLLLIKRKNQKDLYYIEKSRTLYPLYDEAIEMINTSADTIKQSKQPNKKQTTTYDTTLVLMAKKPFINKLKNLFNSSQSMDSTLQITVNRSSIIDSIVDKSITTDSMAHMLTTLFTELKSKNKGTRQQLKRKELALLKNDHIISSQLNKLTTNIEKEQLRISHQDIANKRAHLETSTRNVIILSILAALSILFFLINILRDITKSQQYRVDLEEAKAYAEAILKSKEQLMLSLTHDIKSPLNSIMGISHLLEQDPIINKTHQSYLKNLDTASNHILKLVQNLLDLARLEDGKITIEKEAFNLHNTLSECVSTYRAEAQARGLELRINSNIVETNVYLSDAFRLSQIIANLVSNALKFTSNGSVEISASSTIKANNTEMVRIDIKDTGVGIATSDIKAIMEPFNRGTMRDKKVEGTGLGLSITKKLLTLFKGTLYIESTIDEGSCFSIEIPLERHEIPNSAPLVEIKENKGTLRGKIIWLIDDDATVLNMLGSYLKSLNMKVVLFNNPSTALAEYTNGCTDFILTDIQMPVLNGHQLAKQLKERYAINCPIIGMSGLELAHDKWAKSFTAFLQKPFTTKVLHQTLLSFDESNDKKENFCLKNILLFASGDPEQEQLLINTLLKTEKENADLLQRYTRKYNVVAIAELSHKMINIYQQLKAKHITDLLEPLEKKDFTKLDRSEYFNVAQQAHQQIEALLTEIEESVYSL